MIDIAKLRKLRPYALSNAAADELARLQAANTAALKVADERSKENCALRAALQSIRRLGADNDLPDAWAIVDRALEQTGDRT